MGSLDAIMRENFTFRGFLADMRNADPARCWPFQSIVDYHEFIRLSESTPAPSEVQTTQHGVGAENPEASKVQSKRRRNEKDVNPAVPTVESFDVDEDSDDDISLAEWLKRKGLKVHAPYMALAKPRHADSSGGLNPPSSVFNELLIGVAGPGVQTPTMALAEPPAASLFSGLELLSSVATGLEPGEGVARARVQAPEKPPPDGSSGRLQLLGLRSRMHEPAQGIDGARVQAPEAAPAGPREREVMVCKVSRNPAEFSTEQAKLFLRSL